MKPAWEKLMAEFEGSADKIIGDVDCTAAGKPLCDANGVQGFPTIKYGDPNALEDYKGGRDYEALKKFADENLGPSCGPLNMDLCDDEQKAKIQSYLDMDEDALATAIEEAEKTITDAEENFKGEVEKLQKNYENLMKTKDDTIAGIKDSGLGIMKSVKATKGKTEKKEEL